MNDVKVSIIIPVYNSGDLLNKCLDSASNQTLNDIEIICVDDGSSDNSLDILNQYAKEDSRFKVLSQANQGAGIARNKGLEYSSGEYIVFLDADDYLELEMCELLYDHAKSLDVDLVLFDNRWYLDDGSIQNFFHFDSFHEDYKSFVFDYKYIHNKVLSGAFSVIWTKFYKSSFLKDNGIDFPSHKLYNDMEFHIKSVLLANRIAYYPKIFYHYNKSGHSSLQTNYVGKKEAIVFYDVMCGIRDFLYQRGFIKEFRIDFINFSFRHFYSKINEMEDDYKNEYFLKIKEFLESLMITAKEFNQMSFRNLAIYTHIINSNSYDEYKLRMERFDMEIIDPKKYPDLKDTYNIFYGLDFSNGNFEDDYLDYDFDAGNLEKELSIEKHKNDSNNLYIMRLEDRLDYTFNGPEDWDNKLELENEKLKKYIANLKKTTDEYYKIKENYRLIQEENKRLANENKRLKNGISYKIKKLF